MKTFTRTEKLMGCAFELGVVAEEEVTAHTWLALGVDKIQRLEEQLSEFRPDSLISQINDASGRQPVELDSATFDLLTRSQHISHLTRGYYDPTIGPLKKLYRFRNEAFRMPAKHRIREALQLVGYQYLQLDANARTAFLEKSGMRLSLAAIGKGYAADVVKALWQQEGVQAGYVNASGDLMAFGLRPDGESWRIGIARPDRPAEKLMHLPLTEASVATSGDYEQHFVYKGERYSHNLNAKTGLPLRGIASVSIISPKAELSDALATAAYALGVSKGMDLIRQLPQTHAIIIDAQQGVHLSQQLTYVSA